VALELVFALCKHCMLTVKSNTGAKQGSVVQQVGKHATD
jgi:hypothetical protein